VILKLISFLKGIALFLIIAMSLLHIFLDEESPEMIEHAKTYRPIINTRNEGYINLLNQLKNNSISKEDYILSLESVMKTAKADLAAYNKKKYELAHEFSFNGRSSFGFWMFVFGLSFSFFVLSIRYTYFNIKNNKAKSLKKSFIFESCAWISVSLFWVLHALFATTEDFSSTFYLLMGVLISILMSFAIVLYLKHVSQKQLKVYKIISNLLTLIGDIKVNHYFKMASIARNDDNKDTIQEDTKIVEEKILKSLKKVDELQ
jgi:hypothetical protein